MLVSCVMPTRQRRREFWTSAIESFLSQTYQEKQLVILDEGETSGQEIIDQFKAANIKYTFIPSYNPMITGDKRNYVNHLTDGEVILHWDDDDWSAPTRIEKQLEHLKASGKQVVGFHDLLYFRRSDKTFWKFQYMDKPNVYAVGTSLCYFKKWWQGHLFISRGVGEDSEFSFDAIRASQLDSIDGIGLIVARCHPGNTFQIKMGLAPFLKADRAEFPEGFFITEGII